MLDGVPVLTFIYRSARRPADGLPEIDDPWEAFRRTGARVVLLGENNVRDFDSPEPYTLRCTSRTHHAWQAELAEVVAEADDDQEE